MEVILPTLLIGGQVLSGFQQRAALDMQSDAAMQSAAFEQKQISLQIDRERTQAAVERQQREERLRRALATQRAAFGGIVDIGSGTPFTLQSESVAASKREQELADLETNQRITNLNLEKEQSKIGAQYTRAGLKSQRTQVLFDTASSLGSAGLSYSSGKK